MRTEWTNEMIQTLKLVRSGAFTWDRIAEEVSKHGVRVSASMARRKWTRLLETEQLADLKQGMFRRAISERQTESALKHLYNLLVVLGPCEHHDHHGYCQSHFVESPCRVKAARDWMAENGGEWGLKLFSKRGRG
jgi:hypothetical protein